jgi:drug/metabolite transporter (DMT)-like permease
MPGTPEFAAWAAESKRDTVLITSWTFLTLATCIVLLRLYVRIGIYRKLLPDDWWTLIATICGFVSAALTTVAVENGVGRHVVFLSNAQRENMIFFMTIAFCPAGFFYGLPKVAVVILLCRLMKPKPWLKWTLWTMVLWSILSLIVFMILQFTRCDPPRALWNLEMQDHCRDNGRIIDYAIYANSQSLIHVPERVSSSY